ncbi:hypothetical protein ASPCAL00023 [Aspergillus calidoustus]|uniref:Chitin-binding type-1 domain-containing protein n=1 Tax=Aspergillus calidoustus TaxID=454130 RepID=A0A0U4YU68_ASPCI|nr:hypothetical protein ASPCAL00023 [Aspergillus calidoustus]
MSATSIDGNCGSNSDSHATCLGSEFGNCCSVKGYCGKTDAYCGEGCQLEFGTCNDASVQTISRTGSCGATLTSNVTCQGSTYGDCCSTNGFCGGDKTYCGSGCQPMFGNCFDLDEPESSTSSSTSSTSSTSTDTSPTTTGESSEANSGNNHTISSGGSDGLSTGAIAGISVGAAVGGCAIIALLVWFIFFRRRKSAHPEQIIGEDTKPVLVEAYGMPVMPPAQAVHEMEGKHSGPVELPTTRHSRQY